MEKREEKVAQDDSRQAIDMQFEDDRQAPEPEVVNDVLEGSGFVDPHDLADPWFTDTDKISPGTKVILNFIQRRQHKITKKYPEAHNDMYALVKAIKENLDKVEEGPEQEQGGD